jgi:hypothetical protein
MNLQAAFDGTLLVIALVVFSLGCVLWQVWKHPMPQSEPLYGKRRPSVPLPPPEEMDWEWPEHMSVAEFRAAVAKRSEQKTTKLPDPTNETLRQARAKAKRR